MCGLGHPKPAHAPSVLLGVQRDRELQPTGMNVAISILIGEAIFRRYFDCVRKVPGNTGLKEQSACIQVFIIYSHSMRCIECKFSGIASLGRK